MTRASVSDHGRSGHKDDYGNSALLAIVLAGGHQESRYIAALLGAG